MLHVPPPLPQRVRDLFRRAKFVVGKPGPGVVSEACVSGVPLVVESRAIMSQAATPPTPPCP